MSKTWFGIIGAVALSLGSVGVASACEGSSSCECAHGKDKAAAAKTAKAEAVVLEGTVVSFGCPMEAAKQGCTGAALVVGETRHLIKRGGKGGELVTKAKDSEKVVKVSGTKAGDFLTVKSFEIKG
jgi:hypothetical protein